MNTQNVNCSVKERASFIKKRISEKIKDYDRYAFTTNQDCALKTFFDLAQEFDDQRDFYTICVWIPEAFYQLECRLYLMNEKGNIEMVCDSQNSYSDPSKRNLDALGLIEEQTIINDSFFVPIRGNIELLSSLPLLSSKGILGVFEIHPAKGLTEHMKLFFEKYVNRIGFQLHNRLITEKYKEHLQFIKNLVNDIGHNVIVPNMYFKLFFRRMKGKIDRANALGNEIIEKLDDAGQVCDDKTIQEIGPFASELKYLNESMEDQFQEILSHYEQTSLFLETLLRRSHFEEGRYVIEPRLVNFRENIIRPQLNRYIQRFKERNIAVDNQLSGIPDEEIMLVADLGLISQAYANLFSNALKYTREVKDQEGRTQKFIAVGMEILDNYFGEERDGIKFNVFSTGPHIPSEDVPRLFEEGYRGKNVEREYGTGHGLKFIKEVVELHGGAVEYEPTQSGNNFYFVLQK